MSVYSFLWKKKKKTVIESVICCMAALIYVSRAEKYCQSAPAN